MFNAGKFHPGATFGFEIDIFCNSKFGVGEKKDGQISKCNKSSLNQYFFILKKNPDW